MPEVTLSTPSLSSSPIVLADVGARGGVHRRWAGQAIRFIGFEPDPAECQRLNTSPDALYLPYALWSSAGKQPLYLIESPHGASMMKANYAFINQFFQQRFYEPKGTTSFETVTLDHALATSGLTEVDVLKVDAEGAELEILKGAAQTLQNVFAVELEVWFNPVLQGAPFFSDLDPFMRNAGFQLFDLAKSNFFQRDIRWPKGQLVAADVLYFKVGVKPERTKVDRYVSVALAYGMYDYALEIVREATGLSESEKAERTSKILRAGKGWRFRGQDRLARFFGNLARRLALTEKDYLGNFR